MAPVIKWISDSLRKYLSPFLEFFPVRSISCDVFLVYTICSHQTPLIVITTQPDLRNIFKSYILSDFLRIYMTVIINNRCVFCIFMKKQLCCLCLKQEIIIHKWYLSILPIIEFYARILFTSSTASLVICSILSNSPSSTIEPFTIQLPPHAMMQSLHR